MVEGTQNGRISWKDITHSGPPMSAPRLELTWPNKDKFLLVPKDEIGKPVWVSRDHPAAHEVRLTDFISSIGDVDEKDPYLDNLLFQGDGVDVLRVLSEVPEYRRHYRGKVKLIYIDPPFNTGQAFPHYDDWLEHSTWLSFMRDRLALMRDLLSQDGSIWIHLDDAEAHRMRCLMDEVFGAKNFVATIVWQRVDNARSRATRGVAPAHDFILVYSRSDAFIANQEEEDSLPDHYDQVDASGLPYCSRQLRKTGSSSNRSDRPGMWYPITAPDGTEVWPTKADGSHGRWVWGQARVDEHSDQLDWKKNRAGGWEPFMRIYPADARTVPFTTWWPYDEVGSNRVSKHELRALFPKIQLFDTPKPEKLMQRIIHIGSNPGEIILDVFAGSGTTAAVAHKMGRRWITSEISPSTLSTFTQPRLEKVVSGEDSGGITHAISWNGGGGFRTVRIAPSMYAATEYGVLLTEEAVNGRFSRAVAGQLGFEFDQGGSPFCGTRGRMRLAVFDGAVGVEEVRQLVSLLGEKYRVTVVAKALLPGTQEFLSTNSKGSRVKKAPRDLLLTSGLIDRDLSTGKVVQ